MNTSQGFIKQNLVLIIGLTLPLLLIVLFFVATVLPKHFGTPPQYDLIYSTTRYDYQNTQSVKLSFFVEEGVLKARVAKTDKNNDYNVEQLMLYSAKTESVQPIDLGKLDQLKDGAEITIEQTKNFKIDINNIAPDGYMFEAPTYHGGFVTGMFGNHRTGYRIKKGSVAYKIPDMSGQHYYSNIQFVGWVVGK